MRRVGDLEVDQDLPFERRAWRLQRVGWALILLVAAAALTGLFGAGPLSRRTTGSAGGGLLVEYDRFARVNADSRLRAFVVLPPGAAGAVRLWLDRAYLAVVDVEQVTPQPDLVEAAPDRVTYVFRLARAEGPVEVTFRLTPREFGWHTARLGVEGGDQADFRQLVYP